METFNLNAFIRVSLTTGAIIVATAVVSAATVGAFSGDDDLLAGGDRAALDRGPAQGSETATGDARGGEPWGDAYGEDEDGAVGDDAATLGAAACPGGGCGEPAQPAGRDRSRVGGPGDDGSHAGNAALVGAWLRRNGDAASQRRRRPAARSRSDADEPEAPEEPPDYASIRSYLTDGEERVEDVRDVSEIVGAPSNIVTDEGETRLLAWDLREQEPRGSYLYVLEQDAEDRVAQIHRYFCPERRLDILAETCIPIASVYSDSGAPIAVGYTQQGLPWARGADDLDPSLFSSATDYVEANELLLFLQEYFEAMRS